MIMANLAKQMAKTKGSYKRKTTKKRTGASLRETAKRFGFDRPGAMRRVG